MRPFSDGVPNGAFSLVPKANSPTTVALSTPSIALRSRSASAPPSIVHALAVLERPRDRLLDLAVDADAEHDAVDDGGAVGEVLDRREGDLGPQRNRAHHLAPLP